MARTASTPRTACHPAAGLTLLEVMICVALLAVLGTLAAPDLRRQMERQRLRHAAQALSGDISEARFLSAQRGQAFYVRAESGPSWCWAVSTQGGCGCGQPGACSVHRVNASDHAQVRLLEPFELRLDPSGQAQATARTTLESTHGERLRLDVSLQGRPRLCAAKGHWPQVPDC